MKSTMKLNKNTTQSNNKWAIKKNPEKNEGQQVKFLTPQKIYNNLTTEINKTNIMQVKNAHKYHKYQNT